MWSNTSLHESIKIQNSNKKNVEQKLGKLWDNETIFEEGEQESCILSISGTQSESESNIAILDKSSFSVIFYTLGASLSPVRVQNYKPRNPEIDVLGIKFSPISKDIYYIATQESIAMYDQRILSSKSVGTFKADIDKRPTNMSCFDINCNERLLAAGTEHIGGDTFILFWDIRCGKKKVHHSMPSNFLGGYWQSHTDDITWLAFHPSERDTLASGSTDGLMNVFDLQQSSEDEALKYSLNTESSVNRLGWLTDTALWCTTHTESVQLWNSEDAKPYARVERNDLAMFEDETPDDCYVVNVYNSHLLGQSFLLAGCSTSKRQYLKCLSFKVEKLNDSTKTHLKTHYNLVKNKQAVRDSWLHEKSGILVTAGEGNFLDVWRLKAAQATLVMNIK